MVDCALVLHQELGRCENFDEGILLEYHRKV